MNKKTKPKKHYMGSALRHQFSSLLFSLLEKRGLTIDEVSDKLGWKYIKLVNILAVQHDPTLEEMADIILVLGYALHFNLSSFTIEPLPAPPQEPSP